MDKKIIPSILVDTFEEFNERVEIAEDFADMIHWDIMDGQFVENVTFGDIKEVSKLDTTLNIGAHLMVENPEEMLEPLAKAGVDRVIVHAQVIDDLPAVVKKMEKYDFESGVALSTEVGIEVLEGVADKLDMVLIMTVVPGASGQAMMPEELEKVRELRALYPDLNIGVDGGINLQTIKEASDAGANYFSVNSAIFEAPDPANAYEVLKGLVG